MELLFLPVILIVLFTLYQKGKFDKGEYKKISNNNYFKTVTNTGLFGEYKTFCVLEKIKGEHKILTNIYVPKDNGETTEIDLVFIHETGIYVLESKNYSGWIFGDESNINWTQSLKNGHKERFYNPIKQNNTHIKHLKKFLDVDNEIFKSIIVFSERCTLKKINVTSKDVYVINRYLLSNTIKNIIAKSNTVLRPDEINSIYNKLKQHTCVSDIKKQEHIQQIKDKLNKENNVNVDDKVLSNYKSSCENDHNDVKTYDEDVNTNLQDNIESISKTKVEEKVYKTDKLSINEEKLQKELKEYRYNMSKKEKSKPYFIFTNESLEQIVNEKPVDINMLMKIKGISKVKCEKYGHDIISIVKKYI